MSIGLRPHKVIGISIGGGGGLSELAGRKEAAKEGAPN